MPDEPAFTLDPRLAADTVPVTELTACSLLLMRNKAFPWLILVPRLAGAVELHALPAAMRDRVWAETMQVAQAMATLPGVEKVNLGALGNIVRQLHLHVVGRHPGDGAWPGPVWGSGVRLDYAPGEAEALAALVAARLAEG